MSIEVTQVLVVGRTTPGNQTVTLTDHLTSTIIGSTTSDAVTGIWSISCPYDVYLTGNVVAQAGAGVALGVSSPGVAGGQAGGQAALTSAHPLPAAGAAGQAGGAGTLSNTGGTTQPLTGTAAGAAGGISSGVSVAYPDAITAPTNGASVSSPVTFTGTASTGAGVTAELWDEA